MFLFHELSSWKFVLKLILITTSFIHEGGFKLSRIANATRLQFFHSVRRILSDSKLMCFKAWTIAQHMYKTSLNLLSNIFSLNLDKSRNLIWKILLFLCTFYKETHNKEILLEISLQNYRIYRNIHVYLSSRCHFIPSWKFGSAVISLFRY